MQGPRPLGRLEGIGERGLAIAGRIEMVGQVGNALGSVLAEVQCCAAVQFLSLVGRQTFEQGGPNAVVNKHVACPIRAGPDKVPLPGFLQCGDRLRGGVLGQFGGNVEFILLAQHGPRGKELQGRGGQQLEAPG